MKSNTKTHSKKKQIRLIKQNFGDDVDKEVIEMLRQIYFGKLKKEK